MVQLKVVAPKLAIGESGRTERAICVKACVRLEVEVEMFPVGVSDALYSVGD